MSPPSFFSRRERGAKGEEGEGGRGKEVSET